MIAGPARVQPSGKGVQLLFLLFQRHIAQVLAQNDQAALLPGQFPPTIQRSATGGTAMYLNGVEEFQYEIVRYNYCKL